MPFTSLSAQLTLETQKNEKVHLPALVRTEIGKSPMWDSFAAGDLRGSAYFCLPPAPPCLTPEAGLALYLGRGIRVSPEISPSRCDLDRVPTITPISTRCQAQGYKDPLEHVSPRPSSHPLFRIRGHQNWV